MSLTRAQVRAKLYLTVPGLGVAIASATIQTTSVTDAFTFQSSARGAAKWRGTSIYRAGFSDANRVKPATLVSGAGVLSHGGGIYTDTNTGAVEIVGLVSPDELNDCIQKGLRHVYFPAAAPLSIWTDGDFASATAGTFTPQDTSCTSTKSTTAANNETGFGSLITTNSGANGYTETASFEVTPGEQIYHGAINRATAASMTASYSLRDVTNNAIIGAAITHSERSWQHLSRVDTVPAGCYLIRARLGGTQSNAAIAWDCLPAHVLTRHRYVGPTWLDAEYKLVSLREASYGAAVATSRNVSATRQFADWVRPSMYDLEVYSPEAAPVTLQINAERLPAHDLWYYGRRSWADLAALDDETDTTNADEDYLIAACKYELAKLLAKRYPEEAKAPNGPWYVMERENLNIITAQRTARPAMGRRPIKRMYTPGGRGGVGSW